MELFLRTWINRERRREYLLGACGCRRGRRSSGRCPVPWRRRHPCRLVSAGARRSASHYRVLTWDSRGFGSSSNRNRCAQARPPQRPTWRPCLTSSEIHTAHFVGQSMGGWHTSAFAQLDPQRILSLVYADTVGGLVDASAARCVTPTLMPAGGLSPDRGPQPMGSHPALWAGTAAAEPSPCLPVRGPRLIPPTTNGQDRRDNRMVGRARSHRCT